MKSKSFEPIRIRVLNHKDTKGTKVRNKLCGVGRLKLRFFTGHTPVKSSSRCYAIKRGKPQSLNLPSLRENYRYARGVEAFCDYKWEHSVFIENRVLIEFVEAIHL